jgi:hypothetical protein
MTRTASETMRDLFPGNTSIVPKQIELRSDANSMRNGVAKLITQIRSKSGNSDSGSDEVKQLVDLLVRLHHIEEKLKLYDGYNIAMELKRESFYMKIA